VSHVNFKARTITWNIIFLFYVFLNFVSVRSKLINKFVFQIFAVQPSPSNGCWWRSWHAPDAISHWRHRTWTNCRN